MNRHGFSLLELLIVIALLSLCGGLGIHFISGMQRNDVDRIRHRRNAQEITALAMGATAAGAPVVKPGDTYTTVRNLIEGRAGTVGTFKGRVFRLSPMTDEDIIAAAQHLCWEDGMILYHYQDE